MGYKHHPKPAQPPQRLAYDPVEAAKLLGCSRTKIITMMNDGTLASVKLGKLRRIPHTELMRIITEGVR